MNHPTLRQYAVGVVAALALPVLAACSTGSTSDRADAPDPTTTADADAFPVTVDSALGTAEIAEEPTRIVTIDYVDADVALALGVVPVASQKVVWGGTEEGSTAWFDEKLAEFDGAAAPVRLDMTDGVPIKQILNLEPDLVVGTAGGIQQADYDALTEAGIPVVAHPGTPWLTPWRESVELVGAALGRSDEAGDAIAATEDVLAATRTDYPQLEGTKIAYTYLNPADTSTIGFYNAEDARPRLLEELGAVTPDIVEEVVPADTFYQTMSSERASDVDADVLLTDVNDTKEIDVITKDPLYSQIPAIADGHLYAEVDHTVALPMSAPTPLSIPYAMENFIPKVAAAVDGDVS